MASPELGHKHLFADDINRILSGGGNRLEKLYNPHQLVSDVIRWSNGYIHKTAQSMREVLFDEAPNSPTYRFIAFFVLATAGAATTLILSQSPVVQNTARSLLENVQNFSQLIK